MGNDVHLLDKWYRKDANKVGYAYAIIVIVFLVERITICTYVELNLKVWVWVKPGIEIWSKQ